MAPVCAAPYNLNTVVTLTAIPDGRLAIRRLERNLFGRSHDLQDHHEHRQERQGHVYPMNGG